MIVNDNIVMNLINEYYIKGNFRVTDGNGCAMVVIEQWMSQSNGCLVTLPCCDSRQKRPEKPLMIRHRILSLLFRTAEQGSPNMPMQNFHPRCS